MNELQTFVFSKDQFKGARLASLYSDFGTQQTTNPDGYTANITAWESALAQAAFAGKIAGGMDRLSLKTGQGLLQALETNEWGRPMALGSVIYDAVARGKMIPSQTFLNASSSIYGNPWETNPWNFISWGLRLLGLSGSASEHPPLHESQLVIVENLELASQKLRNTLASRTDRIERIIPMKKFEAEVNTALGVSAGLSPFNLKILLVYLSRDTRQIVFNKKVVKLLEPTGSLPVISTIDESIASLQLLIADMTAQQDLVASRIEQLSIKARDAVLARNRQSAMSILRSKKNHKNLYKSRSDKLTQLEEVYIKLVEAVNQVEVVRVMQKSTFVLRHIHQGMGGVEAVEDIVEGLKEETNKLKDINNIIGESAYEGIIEEDVENEFRALEKRHVEDDVRNGALQRQKDLQSLPSVPGVAAEAQRISIETNTAEDIPALQEPADTSATDALHRLSVNDDEEKQMSNSSQGNRAVENALSESA